MTFKTWTLAEGIFMLALVAVLAGCVRKADLDTGAADVVVVDCVLEESDTQLLQLHYTTSSFGVRPDIIRDASVSVTDLETGSMTLFKYKDNGKYYASMTPVPGRRYRLDIDIEGEEPISAETAFPVKPEFEGGCFFQQDVTMVRIVSSPPCVVWFYGMSPVGEMAPYVASSHHDTDRFNELDLKYKEIVDLDYVQDGYDCTYLEYMSDLFCKMLVTPDPEIEYLEDFVDVYHSKPYHLIGEMVDSTQISKLVQAFVNSNVHDRFVRIPISDKYGNGVTDPYGNLQSDFSVSVNGLPFFNVFGFVCSDEYDKYLRDIYIHAGKIGTSLETYYDHTNLYTNIRNGVGVFGAKASVSVKRESLWTSSKTVYGVYY